MSLVDTLLKLISIESETGKEEKILDFINQFLIENNFKGEILRSSGGIVAVPKESTIKNHLGGANGQDKSRDTMEDPWTP